MKRTWLTKTPIVCLLAIFCCFLWGSAIPSIKIGYGFFNIPSNDTASQLLFAGVRFTLAGVIVICLGSLIGKKVLKPSKKSAKPIFTLAMVQTVMQYVFFYIGLAYTSGVKSSIIGSMNVFLSILAACLLFRYEKMTLKKALGCIIGFAGVVLINLSGGTSGLATTSITQFAGEISLLISSCGNALSAVLIKKFSKDHNPVLLSGYQFFTGGLILTLFGLLFGGHFPTVTASGILLLLYLALVSSVAYTIWGILLKYNPVSMVAIFGFTNPLFGVILSSFLLKEKNQAFTLLGILSLALVSFGIILVNLQKKE